eukprot:c25645_g1_i1 orf=110-319(+)
MRINHPQEANKLDSSWDSWKKEAVNATVTWFFYYDHIAFNGARSLDIRKMVPLIIEFGPTCTPPSSESP